MYLLVNCDRPGCSKQHRVQSVPGSRRGAPMGFAPSSGPRGPISPAPLSGTVSLPFPVASGDVDTHTGTPARVRRAR